MTALRLLIVAADPLARAGLAALLAQQPECTIVAQMAGDSTLLASLSLYQPAVIVWDLGWGTPSLASQATLETLPALLEQLNSIQDAGYRLLLLLTEVTQVGALWTAGVHNLIARQHSGDTLAAALHAVAQGVTVLDTTFVQVLAPPREVTAAGDLVTPREREVLHLVAEGLPNKTIAMRLHISEHTVKFHLNALMSKLGAQSRTEVVVRATRLGLLAL